MIAALVPDVVDPRDWVQPAPLPLLPALRRMEAAGSAGLVVATARMGRSGRICERILLRALGWEPGQRLEIDAMHGMIIMGRYPGRPAHRRFPRWARSAGVAAPTVRDRAWAAADPRGSHTAQVLIVHPAATVATLLAAHYTNLIRTHHDTSS